MATQTSTSSESSSTPAPIELPTNFPTEPKKFLYWMLNNTSRSFSRVIQELPDETKDPVALFYVVLRALDSVEDDTSIEAPQRIALLRAFHTHLTTPGWNLANGKLTIISFLAGEKPHEIVLLENFHIIIKYFSMIPPKYQKVIQDITQKMGNGMADFVAKSVDNVGGVKTLDEWNLYCHYVAGLVGWGLSDIFKLCGLEDSDYFSNCKETSNSMGLFLQKTNIIRDYLEDLEDDRVFWPKEVWSKYAPHIADFREPQNLQNSLKCLNHLITNALEHVPDCLEYMSHVKNINNFRFCAIPQIMAIATLTECYNNPLVFSGVVKIKRTKAMEMVLSCKSMKDVNAYFFDYSSHIIQNIPAHSWFDGSTNAILQKILKLTAPTAADTSLGWPDALAAAGLIFSGAMIFGGHLFE